MLEVRELACVRGDRRLFRGIGFELGPGTLLRVQGANGAGKTSLLRILAGLGLPAAGEVRWQGAPIRRQREAYAAALCYLGHLVGLKDELTPAENLHIEAGLAGWPAADAGRIAEALAFWGIERQAALPLRVLSAGQRRRAALARLLLAEASPLWILDEPFTALDVHAVARLAGVVEQRLARGGIVVLTSHQEVPLAGAAVQTLTLQ